MRKDANQNAFEVHILRYLLDERVNPYMDFFLPRSFLKGNWLQSEQLVFIGLSVHCRSLKKCVC